MTEQQYKKFTDVCNKVYENMPTLKQYKLIVLTDVDGTRVLMQSKRKKTVKSVYHCLLWHLKELEKEGKRLNFDAEIKISVIGKKESQQHGKKRFNKSNGNRQAGRRRPFPNKNGNGQSSNQASVRRAVINKKEGGK